MLKLFLFYIFFFWVFFEGLLYSGEESANGLIGRDPTRLFSKNNSIFPVSVNLPISTASNPHFLKIL